MADDIPTETAGAPRPPRRVSDPPPRRADAGDAPKADAPKADAPKADAPGAAAPPRRAQGGAGAATVPQPDSAAPLQAGRVVFDTANLKSSYCNVCNGSSTREEVVLNFGVNSAWDRPGGDRLTVALHHRIVLSPHAAKRVRDMLVRLIDEHEARHGRLDP